METLEKVKVVSTCPNCGNSGWLKVEKGLECLSCGDVYQTEEMCIEEKVEADIFVAEDGTQFPNERDCENYERATRWANLLKLPTRLPQLDYICPLNYEDCSESSSFVWFKLVSAEDVEALNKLLPETVDGFVKPGTVCVENRFDDYYTFYFEDSLECAVKFFKAFGLTVGVTPSVVPQKKNDSCGGCKDCMCSSCIKNQSISVVGCCIGCEYCGKEDITCLVAGNNTTLKIKNGGENNA